ncbi:ectoine/hydroxyectoine ABC transporter permease subunit EhuC [Antarctobacter heliothermus]|uniref:Polar amino acid transport system permease protein n=1 Tax=Antarctobacter heliothermus TaxID=74033 RepID=A0A239IT45_9RHOB|nr:ectoine/hydroxyectoine ABC transporter permease subunit EhuC [Antarctobacter heliothermus]SNS96761.1 polar amino acid transport system permease protein [Antarctobacter heliothermus]
MEVLVEFFPLLLKGATVTIQLTVVSAVIALVISFVVGLARLSRYRVVRVLSVIYLEFFRGTSALVQMFFMFYVLPLFGLTLAPFAAGFLACGMNLGSYGSEVVRGAIKSVGKPQREAALSLNYTTFQLYRHVLIPQAIPMMIPPFGNLLIELMKLTAVASLITISDLTFAAQIVRAQTGLTLEPFLLILVVYFLIASVLVGAVDLLAWRIKTKRKLNVRTGN